MMTSLLTTNWFVALAGGLLYLATTFFCFVHTKYPPLPVAEKTDTAAAEMLRESWNFRNPEFDRMLEDLKQERTALEKREQQLKELELRLASERHEIDVVTQAIFRLQHDLDSAILRIRQDEVPNLKKLAKVHAAMSPQGAAGLLKQQSDDDVVKVLFYLKPDEVGPILEAFSAATRNDPQRAARVAERLRRTAEGAAGKGRG